MQNQQGWKDAEEFRGCVKSWADRIGVQPRVISLRPMRRKWASCSTEGRLTFNAELLSKSRAFGEYVIVHDLLHLQIPHHGKLFRRLLTAYLPDWEQVAVEGRAGGDADPGTKGL